VFRALAREDNERLARAVLASAPSKDGADGQASLAKQIRATKPTVTKWGWVRRDHMADQKLLWRIRGTKRQEARPIADADLPPDEIAERVAAAALEAIAAWDREVA